MSPDAIETARLLAAHAEWGWREAMLPTLPPNPSGLYVPGVQHERLGHSGLHLVDSSLVPDLDDDATGGVLLGMLPLMLRHAAHPEDSVWRHGRHWRVRLDGALFAGETLGAVAGKALLAVWSKG